MKFTTENARSFAERGNAARAEKRRVAAASPEGHAGASGPMIAVSGESYRARKLVRVRAQWDRLDAVLDALIDRGSEEGGDLNPQAIDRVTGAIGRLEEVERRLSDRSTPPSIRAGPPRRQNLGLME
jgi:hypothetical protein